MVASRFHKAPATPALELGSGVPMFNPMRVVSLLLLCVLSFASWWLWPAKTEAPPVSAKLPLTPSFVAESAPQAHSALEASVSAILPPDAAVPGRFFDPAVWVEQRRRLAASNNYRAFIHQVLSQPSREGVMAARHAVERCLGLSFKQRFPKGMQPPESGIADGLAMLERRCAEPLEDQFTALAAASKRVGLDTGWADNWMGVFAQKGGLPALAALGDGDLIAVAGATMDLRKSLGTAPGIAPWVYSAAWMTSACELWLCDKDHLRLQMCLLMQSCTQSDLRSQLRATVGTAVDEAQWQKVLSAVRGEQLRLRSGGAAAG